VQEFGISAFVQGFDYFQSAVTPAERTYEMKLMKNVFGPVIWLGVLGYLLGN
jgi:hypothetical protein